MKYQVEFHERDEFSFTAATLVEAVGEVYAHYNHSWRRQGTLEEDLRMARMLTMGTNEPDKVRAETLWRLVHSNTYATGPRCEGVIAPGQYHDVSVRVYRAGYTVTVVAGAVWLHHPEDDAVLVTITAVEEAG